MRIDRDGTISRSRVTRSLPVSDSPLLDALNALLQGPAEAEARAGLRTLIPEGTRVRTAYVRDSTAYISFSEEFQFNPYGVEGWASQLRQVVWTATEFSTVKNVQILIEGRRVNYLGEGIWIGAPVGREDL
jgi:spore germination protein GerM